MATYPTQTLTTAQHIPVTLHPVDAAGKAVALDATPTMKSDNVAVATVGNPTGAWVVNGVAPGTANITVAGTSAGGTPLSESFAVSVAADPATTFGLTFGAPY